MPRPSQTESAPAAASTSKTRLKNGRIPASGGGDPPSRKEAAAQKEPARKKYHFNNIWSIWYCVLTVAFTSYLVYINIKRFLFYASLPWPGDEQPYLELNAHVGLVGAAVVVMPFFIVSGMLKVGNLANDGFKLGASLSTCSRDPPSIIQPTTGVVRNLWMHGVPTAPFLHLVAGFCLLLPRVIMDASMIRAGFLPRDEIWKTDMDIFIPQAAKPLVSLNHSIPLPPHLKDSFSPAELQLVRIKSTGQPPAVDRHDIYPGVRSQRSASVAWNERAEAFTDGAAPKTKGQKDQNSVNEFFKNIVTSPSVPFSESRLRSNPGFDSLRKKLFMWDPISPEIINYAFALLVFSIRYSSVFWSSSKKFSALFSVQLLMGSVQTLLTMSSFSILFKLQSNQTQGKYAFEPLVLCRASSLALTVMCVLIVTTSSSSLYFYGFQRFTMFLCRSRRRYHIMYRDEPMVTRPHTAQIMALLTLIVLGGCYGPLIWDLTTVYNGSSDGVVLASIVGTILYLFLWIVLWIFLSLKTRWTFKLRVTVARAYVASARSIKLVNDVEMSQPESRSDSSPLLIVGNGKAYAIQDKDPQKAIFEVVQKTREEKRGHGQEEDIYWLRPPLGQATPRASPRKNPGRNSRTAQPKVTFNDNVQEGPSTRMSDDEEESEEEVSDYALLRQDINLGTEEDSDDSDQGPRFTGRNEDPRYVDRNQMLAYRQVRSPLDDNSPSSPELVAPDYEETEDQFDEEASLSPRLHHHMLLDNQGPLTPRSNRSADSGVPPEVNSQRSDSLSSGSSSSPPENSEESGIHPGVPHYLRNRSNSFDDLTQLPSDNPRNVTSLSLHPSVHRPPLMNISGPYGYCRNGRSAPPTILYRPSEGTVAIRRQRHLTQEIKPPVDPIYGTRKLTSFTEAPKDLQIKKWTNEDALVHAQNTFNSTQSNSSGYHSSTNASSSSASNSSSNSPVPPSPFPSQEPASIIYGTKGTQRPVHTRINLQHESENPYGQRMHPHPPVGPSFHKYPQAPQIPLPPIPQGEVAPNFQSHHTDLYGRTNGPQFPTYPRPHGSMLVGRTSSLPYPSNPGIQKQYTNTLPHVLPKESYYNTNV